MVLQRNAKPPERQREPLRYLALGALGIVYGDIGTSPLYAVRACFTAGNGIQPDARNILGILSLIVWSLILVVSVKYLMFVVRADARGEGGILALMTLVTSAGARPIRFRGFLVALGIFGAALLYGDGMITPAISVLGAVEGLKVATPVVEPYVLPIVIGVLTGLFLVQRKGTGTVGMFFGPVMVLWFGCIGLLGIPWILRYPAILAAMNPWHGVMFFVENRGSGFLALGGVLLVVTGAETLYADLGHFGRSAIRRAWFAVALPGLLLNYFGQGALLIERPEAIANPFYLLAPRHAVYPLVLLATVATVIASQAVIAGAFSLSHQALQLGFLPRMSVRHTSSYQRGQVYLPAVNWLLLVSSVGVAIGFGSANRLAGAYGIAITSTMVITTGLAMVCARHRWQWTIARIALVAVVFLGIDVAFLGANVLKIAQGGWFPLAVAGVVFTLMRTWKLGRTILARRMHDRWLPSATFVKDLEENPPLRVPGTAVFLARNTTGVPITLLHNLKHNRVLHERVLIISMKTEDTPRLPADERLEIRRIRDDIVRMVGHYGFMETPDVPELLRLARKEGVPCDPEQAVFFLGRETLVHGMGGMAKWRGWLFSLMSRNAERATAHFRIPTHRVIEIGMQVEL